MCFKVPHRYHVCNREHDIHTELSVDFSVVCLQIKLHVAFSSCLLAIALKLLERDTNLHYTKTLL